MSYRVRHSVNGKINCSGRNQVYRVEGTLVDEGWTTRPVEGLVIGRTEGEIEKMMRNHRVTLQRASPLHQTDLSSGIIDLSYSSE